MPDTLTFSRSLYLPEAVQAAAEAYSQVAGVEVVTNEHDVIVHIAADPAYGTRVLDAFSNHALLETIVRSREQLGGSL